MKKVGRVEHLVLQVDGDREHSIPSSLLKHSKDRSADILRRLNSAMKKIEAEIEENEGLYPFNGGRLNQAEVCRRAGVSNVTLQGKIHKTSSKLVVDDFVARVRIASVTGRKTVRRRVTDRAEYWKEAHKKIAQAYHIHHLQHENALARIQELEQENEMLRAQLAIAFGQKIDSASEGKRGVHKGR